MLISFTTFWKRSSNEHTTSGKTLPEFEASWEMRWLVQRGIEIISEASRGIPDAAKSLRPEIPWKRVAGIGNVLRHDYSGIADHIIWIIWGVSVMNFPSSRQRSKQSLQR